MKSIVAESVFSTPDMLLFIEKLAKQFTKALAIEKSGGSIGSASQ
jgi:hypothetical protein